MTEEALVLVVSADASGERLDRFLAVELDQPRNQVKRWIQAGRVSVDERVGKASRTLHGGETVRCLPPESSADARVEPEHGELEVLYEDPTIVVLNKPVGLAMHPGAGRATGTLAHRLVAAYPEMSGVGGPGRPGIVHRLDIDTTGVVVVARTSAAYRTLSRDFAERHVEKNYLGLCYGAPRPDEGSWTGPIGRHPNRRREMTVRADGRPARTDYAVVASLAGVSLLRILLGTGRTHQIRVHLKSAGHPLVGDPVYGEARWKALEPGVRRPLREFGRPALHAWTIGFGHPVSGERLTVSAPPPADLRDLWEQLTGGSPLPV